MTTISMCCVFNVLWLDLEVHEKNNVCVCVCVYARVRVCVSVHV